MTKPSITQEEINSIVWKACDTFRGVVDPSEYKNYILVFLFIKYLSDVWKDKYDKHLETYKSDSKRALRAMSRERFIVPEHSSYDYFYEHRNDNNIGEIINTGLQALDESNRGKLDGVFRNIDFNSESNLGRTKDRNSRLKHLIEDFSDPKLDLRPSRIGIQDIIGNTYEYLISRFASDAGKKGGEFYTPAEVSLLIAKLLDPQPGDRICDPACGSGSLLIKVANEVGNNDFSIYGQESNGSTWALCKMNMFLHDMDGARIEWGDTIRNPLLIEGDKLMKFHKVVANPPFSLDKWGIEVAEADKYERFWRGIPPKSTGDFAFISHMIETLNEYGKVGVVVPHGVLFRGGKEGKIRKKLIEDNLLEAVIGLPAQLFYGTGIPATILIFNKAKQTKDVLFIDASNECESGSKQNKLREKDIERVVSTYNNFKFVDKYAFKATIDEIQENDFNLNIPRYVDTFEEEELVDIGEVQKEIDEVSEKMRKIEKNMESYLSRLK
ncbi:MAG: type I restriction-modification system subunit M [Pseudomonadales bacterium]|nr:type I restriction-modification system subunit M [Pseudomonadales bacterium]